MPESAENLTRSDAIAVPKGARTPLWRPSINLSVILKKLLDGRKKLLNVCVRSGNNVCCDNFTERVSSCGACLNSSLNSTNVTTNHNAYKSGTDLLRTNKYNVSSPL